MTDKIFSKLTIPDNHWCTKVVLYSYNRIFTDFHKNNIFMIIHSKNLAFTVHKNDSNWNDCTENVTCIANCLYHWNPLATYWNTVQSICYILTRQFFFIEIVHQQIWIFIFEISTAIWKMNFLTAWFVKATKVKYCTWTSYSVLLFPLWLIFNTNICK